MVLCSDMPEGMWVSRMTVNNVKGNEWMKGQWGNSVKVKCINLINIWSKLKIGGLCSFGCYSPVTSRKCNPSVHYQSFGQDWLRGKQLDSLLFWDFRTHTGFQSTVLWQEFLVVVRAIQKFNFWQLLLSVPLGKAKMQVIMYFLI